MENMIRSPAFLIIVALFILAEWLWRTRVKPGHYDVEGATASIGLAIGNILLRPLNASIVGFAFLGFSQLSILDLSHEDWRVWVVGFLGVEFLYYWFHRWSHTIRWLWASHAVHHSAEEFTFPAAIRLGWTNALSGGWLVFVPLIIIGLPPVMVATLLSANLAYQFFLHTETIGKLGPLEWIFNTPSHHRVHHGSNVEYLDKNFGGVLIVFDRLFGTFAEEEADIPMQYGLVHPVKGKNPINIAFHEWARLIRDLHASRSIGEIWQAVAGRPK